MKAPAKPSTVIILILFFPILFSCRNENSGTSSDLNILPNKEDCECPIPQATTESGRESKYTLADSFGIGGEVKVDVPKLKNLIKAQMGASLSGRYEQENISSETIYWEILQGNPEIAQHANLYRGVTCALIEIACENTTLDGKKLALKKEELVREYFRKVDEIVKYARQGVRTPTAPPGPRQKGPSVNGPSSGEVPPPILPGDSISEIGSPNKLHFWGEVTDNNGNDVDEASIELKINGQRFDTQTGLSGNFRFEIEVEKEKVISENYYIEVKKQGCETIRDSITPSQEKKISLHCPVIKKFKVGILVDRELYGYNIYVDSIFSGKIANNLTEIEVDSGRHTFYVEKDGESCPSSPLPDTIKSGKQTISLSCRKYH